MIERLVFDSKYFDLYKLNRHCYAVISNTPENISNAGFIDLGERVVVFDTLLSVEAAKDMKRAIDEMTNAKQTMIVLSHWHSDHYLGNCAFPKGTIILASTAANRKIRENMPALQDRDELLEEIRELEMALVHETDEKEILQIENALKFNRNFAHPELELRYPNMTIHGEMKIIGASVELALRTMEIAHSEGDLIGFVEKDRVLFAGDLIFADNHPYLGAGDPIKLKEELKKLIEMDIEYFVPGHGEVCDKDEVQRKIEYIDAIMKLVEETLDSEKELSTGDLPKKFHHYASPSFEWNVKFLREYLRK